MLLSKSHDSSSNSVADVPSIGKRDLFNALPLLGITVIDADSVMDEKESTILTRVARSRRIIHAT